MRIKQKADTEQGQSVWVFGGGKFGLRAVNMLMQKDTTAKIVVVDSRQIRGLPESVMFVRDDCVAWLAENLTPDAAVDKIVPAVPCHLASKWLTFKLLQMGISVKPLPLANELLEKLPNPYCLSEYQAAVSFADFLCPSDCNEPAGYCTHTGKERSLPLYSLLHDLQHESIVPIIIQSRQFAPGVGGFYPDDLYCLLKQVTSSSAQQLIIGTACNCHGIIDGLLVPSRR